MRTMGMYTRSKKRNTVATANMSLV